MKMDEEVELELEVEVEAAKSRSGGGGGSAACKCGQKVEPLDMQLCIIWKCARKVKKK